MLDAYAAVGNNFPAILTDTMVRLGEQEWLAKRLFVRELCEWRIEDGSPDVACQGRADVD